MSASKSPHHQLLRELSGLMVAVSGESVTMIKRSAPEQALKLKPKQEWQVYLEFLQALFNLADRLSVFHLPIQDQPLFMDSLEDAVTEQLRSVLSSALGEDSDAMEIVLTVGKAVSESRQRYERFRFVVTEESKAREEFLQHVADRIAQAAGAPGNGMITSAATLCTSSAIGAMQALFAHTAGPGTAQAFARQGAEAAPAGAGNEIKLVSVMATVTGDEVETRWGLHPRFRKDLLPDEAQQLTQLMNRVTTILGSRYAEVAFSPEWASWHRIGHA
jgi:hypothetical protein